MFGATPDGIIITQDGEIIPLEIKCPLNWSKGKPVKWMVNGKLVKIGDGHDHFFQIQLQLLLCKVQCPIHIFAIFFLHKVLGLRVG